MTDLINKVKEYITSIAVKNDENLFLEDHVLLMADAISSYAKELGLDEEMCILAVLFHDINKLQHIDKQHHIKGAEQAYKYLLKEGYPEDKAKIVHDMILTHSSDDNHPPITVEQKLLYSVDGLGAFKNFFGIFYGVITRQDLTEEEANIKIRKKYIKAWEKVSKTPIVSSDVKKEKEAIYFLLGIED